MSDQADSLRHLFAAKTPEDPESAYDEPERPEAIGWTLQSEIAAAASAGPVESAEPIAAPKPTRVVSLVSGKGGAGASVLSHNLAVSLARRGDRVVLVDADYGLGQLEILCDRRPTVDLEDVLAGRIAPEEALVEGPEGIRLLAGSHAARMNEAWLVGPATDELVAQVVSELREKRVADWILVDAGSGLTARSQTLAAASDAMILVSTTEQAAIAASHALLSHLRRAAGSHLKLLTLINKSPSHRTGDEAADRLIHAARLFQGISVGHLGVVRDDSDVPRAVHNRISVVQAPVWWLSTAARDIERISAAVRSDFENWATAATEMALPTVNLLGTQGATTLAADAAERSKRKAG
jgi:flagellar biosynthesis protein FlhG